MYEGIFLGTIGADPIEFYAQVMVMMAIRESFVWYD